MVSSNVVQGGGWGHILILAACALAFLAARTWEGGASEKSVFGSVGRRQCVPAYLLRTIRREARAACPHRLYDFCRHTDERDSDVSLLRAIRPEELARHVARASEGTDPDTADGGRAAPRGAAVWVSVRGIVFDVSQNSHMWRYATGEDVTMKVATLLGYEGEATSFSGLPESVQVSVLESIRGQFGPYVVLGRLVDYKD